MGALLAAPLASVSVLAWLGTNPFNGVVFAVLTLALVFTAIWLPAEPVRPGRTWTVVTGALMAAFGWFYPHFLESASWAAYACASPLGLIPCPSLSAVVGVGLILGGFGSRRWSGIVAAAAVMYGLVGVLRLGVTIDAVLIAGALALGATVVNGKRDGSARAGNPAGDDVRHGRWGSERRANRSVG